jgi:hypothetical protein
MEIKMMPSYKNHEEGTACDGENGSSDYLTQ